MKEMNEPEEQKIEDKSEPDEERKVDSLSIPEDQIERCPSCDALFDDMDEQESKLSTKFHKLKQSNKSSR